MNALLRISQKIARRLGYRVEPIREPVAALIDVLDLLVRREAARTSDFFVLQIGANDGVRFDPIHRYISEYHWRGLLVEPVPSLFAQLRENYKDEPQLQFANVAIGATDGTLTLYTIAEEARDLPDHVRGLTTVDRDLLLSRRWQFPNIDSLIREIAVPCVTVKTLWDQHQVTRVDLLMIDIEGYDYEVLKLWDFGRIKPKIIQYEHAHVSPADHDASMRLLISHGYRVVLLGDDTIAALEAGDSNADHD